MKKLFKTLATFSRLALAFTALSLTACPDPVKPEETQKNETGGLTAGITPGPTRANSRGVQFDTGAWTGAGTATEAWTFRASEYNASTLYFMAAKEAAQTISVTTPQGADFTGTAVYRVTRPAGDTGITWQMTAAQAEAWTTSGSKDEKELFFRDTGNASGVFRRACRDVHPGSPVFDSPVSDRMRTARRDCAAGAGPRRGADGHNRNVPAGHGEAFLPRLPAEFAVSGRAAVSKNHLRIRRDWYTIGSLAD